MFDALKQEPRGLSSRHKRRMIVSIGAALALGGVVYTGGSTFVSDAPKEFPVARSRHPVTGSTRELDRNRFSALATGAGSQNAIDVDALRYVLSEVARDRSLRAKSAKDREDLIKLVSERAKAAHEPFAREHYLLLGDEDVTRLEPAAAVALAPYAAGRYVEVKGFVHGDGGKSVAIPGIDSNVYGCFVEGKDGSRVLVLDRDTIRDRRPPLVDIPSPAADDAPTALTPPRAEFGEGQLIRARGYFVQTFSGRIGPFDASKPVAVVVGREYRPSTDPPAPPKSLIDVAASDTDDRVLEDTWSVETMAHFVALHWADSKGHDELLRELGSGELKWIPWERSQFLRWSADLERPAATPDPRAFTNEARGRVFRLSGVLVAADLEDWDVVEDNAHDVGRRFVYRLISDDYGQDAMIRFDSPFPLSTFQGVYPPDRMHPQRVRIYGAFLRNHSYVPSAAEESAAAAARGEHHVTVPEFIALHIAPDPIRPSAPLLSNPFFWSWVCLLVFAVLFFGVMRRVDKKEEARYQARERRVRHGIPAALARRPSQTAKASPAGPGAAGDASSGPDSASPPGTAP